MKPSMLKKLENTLLTTTTRDHVCPPCCVIAITKRYAVSFHHGLHAVLREGQEVVLYSVKLQMDFKSIVKKACPCWDLVVFELIEGEFEFFPKSFRSMHIGQSYMQLAINELRNPVWKGVEFFSGTTHGRLGDSGSGIFDQKGRFLGISVGKRDFRFRDSVNMPICEIADHHSDTKIVGSEFIAGMMIEMIL